MSQTSEFTHQSNDEAQPAELSSDITSSDTTISVSQLASTPATPYWALLSVSKGKREIVEVTSEGSGSITVNRGAKSTTAKSFSSGDRVDFGVQPADILDQVNGTDIQDSGTSTVSNATTLNFNNNLTVTDDGSGQATVDASGGGGGTSTLPAWTDDTATAQDYIDGLAEETKRTAWASGSEWLQGPSNSSTEDFKTSTLLPDGRVLFANSNAGNLVFYNPYDQTVESGPSTAFTSGDSEGKIDRIHTLSDGRVAVLSVDDDNGNFDSIAFRFRYFDLEDETFSSVQASGGIGTADDSVLTKNENVVFIDQDDVKLYDTSADSFSTFSSPVSGETFESCGLSPDGRILVVPEYPGTTSDRSIALLDPQTDTYTKLSNSQYNVNGRDGYADPVIAPTGEIVLLPYQEATVTLLIDPIAESVSTGLDFSTTSASGASRFFTAATLLGDGRILGTPYVDQGCIYDPSTDTAEIIPQPSSFSIDAGAALTLTDTGTVVFSDNKSFWLEIETYVSSNRNFALHPLINQ